MEGLKSNVTYALEVLKGCDILCLQEHWMISCEATDLTEYFPQHDSIIKCIDDNNPTLPSFRPRGTAGTAILWKHEIDHIVEPVPDGSDRVCTILIHTSNPLLVINTYMPTEGTTTSAEYSEIQDEVYEIIKKYNTFTPLWVGDINAAPSRNKPTKNDVKFKNFCIENNLQIAVQMPDKPSFHHFNGKSTSRIDHFIHRAGDNPIASIHIRSREPTNLSMHDPLTAHVPAHIPTLQARKKSACLQKKIRWDKVDKSVYKEATETKLGALLSQMYDLPAEIITSRLNCILQECATKACPPPPDRKRRTKYRWLSTFKPLADELSKRYKNLQRLHRDTRKNSPQLQAYKAAKRILRKAQRQAAAKRRKDIQQAIISSCKVNNRDEFHKLIKNQRKTRARQATVEFGIHTDQDSQADSWANYYQELATPKDDDTFDEEYNRHIETVYLLQALTTSGGITEPVSIGDVEKHVTTLKNQKAADIFGVAAEHVKFSAPCILKILCHLANDAFKTGKLPASYKLGSITPVIKKAKPQKLPGNYRRITITSIVGKIVEMHMVKHARPILDSKQSSSQFGFTSGSSPVYASLILTEVLAEAKDKKEEIMITLMDTSKAFDVVSHKGMLNALHQQGIAGNLWKLFDSLYTDIKASVKWQGEQSKEIDDDQGIRQGGNSSADCYKSGKNKVLRQIDNNPTLKIGCINAGAVMVADDLALAAKTATQMQTVINIATADASRERYKFNVEKTKVIAINCKTSPELLLNNQRLGTSTKEVHLGIHRNQQNNNVDTIDDRIKAARRAAFGLMGAGLYGLNGVGAEIAVLQYNIYVIPTMLYALEALVLSDTEMGRMSNYHRKNLRAIQHFPKSTAIPAIFLLSGSPPLQATLDIRVLSLFRRIVAADVKTPPALYIQDLITRQLAMKEESSSSWVNHVKQLLRKYQLPSAYNVVLHPPKKKMWKRMIEKAVMSTWTTELQEEAMEKSTLEFLNVGACKLGQVHPVWMDISCPLDVQKASVKAQLLVKRYPLATSHTAGKKKKEVCPLCGDEDETTTHFLLHCTTLATARQPYLRRILYICKQYSIEVSTENITKLILDSSYLPEEDGLEKLTRNMTFKLHCTRSMMLGGISGYKLAYKNG